MTDVHAFIDDSRLHADSTLSLALSPCRGVRLSPKAGRQHCTAPRARQQSRRVCDPCFARMLVLEDGQWLAFIGPDVRSALASQRRS